MNANVGSKTSASACVPQITSRCPHPGSGVTLTDALPVDDADFATRAGHRPPILPLLNAITRIIDSESRAS